MTWRILLLVCPATPGPACEKVPTPVYHYFDKGRCEREKLEVVYVVPEGKRLRRVCEEVRW